MAGFRLMLQRSNDAIFRKIWRNPAP